jgi:hypothetical protein
MSRRRNDRVCPRSCAENYAASLRTGPDAASSTRSYVALMKPAHPRFSAPSVLVWVIAALALVAALAGLVAPDGAGPVTVQTVHGEDVELYGEGLYRRDSLFKGASNVGTDVVTLAIGLPLLLASLAGYRRGSARGALLLLGALTWFLYVYATYALSVTFNELFLVYVALASASLFAFVLLWRFIDPQWIADRVPDGVRRRTAALMLASGALTFLVWVLPLLGALITGDAPKWLDDSSTMVTDALDLAVITPSAMLAGVLLHRREPLGYPIAIALLVLLLVLAPAIIAQTISQLAVDIQFAAGEVIGPIAGFLVLATIAGWCLRGILRAA